MKKLNIVIIIILSLIILGSASYLIYVNLKARKEIESSVVLRNLVVKDIEEVETKETKQTEANSKNYTDFIDKYLKRKIDFAALKQRNKNVDQWLYYPETKFDFPVVMEPEVNEYYYDMIGFDGFWTGAGTPLIPKSPGERDFRTLILAHRMIDYWGEDDYFFSNLPKRWMDKENASKHKYVYTYKDNKAYRWQIWTGMPLRGDDFIYQTPFEKGSKDYQNLLDHVKSNANYTIGEAPSNLTPTLMLSTCSRYADNVNVGRYVAIFQLDLEYDQETGHLKYFKDEANEEFWKELNEHDRKGELRDE